MKLDEVKRFNNIKMYRYCLIRTIVFGTIWSLLIYVLAYFGVLPDVFMSYFALKVCLRYVIVYFLSYLKIRERLEIIQNLMDISEKIHQVHGTELLFQRIGNTSVLLTEFLMCYQQIDGFLYILPKMTIESIEAVTEGVSETSKIEIVSIRTKIPRSEFVIPIIRDPQVNLIEELKCWLRR